MGTILTRQEVLDAKDILLEEVPVPEWGGSVMVKGMTGKERDEFETSVIVIRGKNQTANFANVRAKLASMTVCDAGGQRLFQPEDIRLLGDKSAAALQRVFEVAQRLSGLSEADVEELTSELKESPLPDSASA